MSEPPPPAAWFGQSHGFLKSRPTFRQLVLVLVISLDLVRVLVQDEVVLVLDI